MRGWNRGMTGWLNVAGLMLSLTAVSLLGTRAEAAEPADTGMLKAAFVRGNELWVQNGDAERQLTQGDYVRHPKWSFDNTWLAFTKGEQEQELWVLHVPTGAASRLSANGGAWSGFQWAPDANRLAYLSEQRLVWVDPRQPEQAMEVAADVGNFSWLPDGGGMLASTAAKLPSVDGWLPVAIVKLPLTAAGEPLPRQTLYTLPKPSDQFLAVGTSGFKWSADGKWIAFLATPTASLSSDSNALCLLSADGASFKAVDQMVRNEQWFSWAGEGHKLAYIAGIGREATSNKQLKVMVAPNGKPTNYTPAGYVEQGFAWMDAGRIVTARAREGLVPEESNASYGTGGPNETDGQNAPRPYPSLVGIELKKGRQHPITSPSSVYGDYAPTPLTEDRLAWVQSNRRTAQVIVAEGEGTQARTWIRELDLGANFYEQWDWSAVFQFAH